MGKALERILEKTIIAFGVGVMLSLFMILSLGVSALEAFVVWKGYLWHLAPIGGPALPFMTIWVLMIILVIATRHLIDHTPRERPWLLLFVGRPIAALMVLLVFWWLR